jgi:GMP synthase-like glutamine amidotransferase
MNIHYFQHVPFEGPGTIAEWVERHGHKATVTRFFSDDEPPDLNSIDWLIVMGGPMGIHEHDKYPWLVGEKTYIRQAIEAGKVVLGICLGAQLIADVLGARVVPKRHKEIGWFPVQLTSERLMDCLADGLNVFHWHGDTFELPPGAERIASSEACINQGFLFSDRVVALQFHLETTPESAAALIANCGDELVDAPWIQKADEMLGDAQRFHSINQAMACLLDHLASQQ